MKRLLIGVVLTLTCIHAQARENLPGPMSGNQKPSVAASTKGLSGARRYQLLFGPDLDVIGALKMPPDVSLAITMPSGTSLPWIPIQSTPITLGANIQYIGASEIQSVQFLLDGNPISNCTAPSSNYEVSCTFTAAQAGAHTLKVKLTDTDGKPTESAVTNAEFVNSEVMVLRSPAIIDADPARYLEGYVCSTGYFTPLQVRLAQDSSTITTDFVADQASDALINSLCKSNGTAYKFRVLLTPTIYANHSDDRFNAADNVRLEATPAAPGQPKHPFFVPALNYKPEVSALTVQPAATQYTVGQVITLKADLYDDSGFSKVEYFRHDVNGAMTTICSNAVNLVAQYPYPSDTCTYPLPAGTSRFSARATDFAARGSVVGPMSQLTPAITTEPAGTLQFSASTYSVAENGSQAAITVNRVGGAGGAISVQYATSNGSATQPGDYTASSGTLSWAANDSAAKTFTVPVVNDSTSESNETITLGLSAPTGGATLGTPNSATLTITDDDGVAIVKPSAGGQFPTHQAILIEASVPMGTTVQEMQFYAGSTWLGTVKVPPYVLAWNEIPSGTHALTARAYTSLTAYTPSAAISVVVGDSVLPQGCPVASPKSRLFEFLGGLGFPLSNAVTPSATNVAATPEAQQ